MLDDLNPEADVTGPTLASGFNPFGADVLSLALRERSAGRPCVIVTLVEIDGSSPRALGAQMAVAANGEFAGSITSGCLERAIVATAQDMIVKQEGGVVRFGKDSNFRDIVLPCGSGVDLLFSVNPPLESLKAASDAQQKRRPVTFEFCANDMRSSDERATFRQGDRFNKLFTPPLQIVAAGLGAELSVLSRLAVAAGHTFCAASPDLATLNACGATRSIRLQSVSSAPAFDIDEWTAVVLLFHDREWDVSLLPALLTSPAFFIGAVGSPRTQNARLDALKANGVEETALNRLKGPIGLIPATRDPSTLAVSVLAEILNAWPHGR